MKNSDLFGVPNRVQVGTLVYDVSVAPCSAGTRVTLSNRTGAYTAEDREPVVALLLVQWRATQGGSAIRQDT